MYIIGLNPYTGEGPSTIYQEESEMYFIPAVTDNGHFTVLPAGKEISFEVIKNDIQNQVRKLEPSGVLYACVSCYVKSTEVADSLIKMLPSVFPEHLKNEPFFFPSSGPFISQVLSYNPPNPYLEQIYKLLDSPKKIGDKEWHNCRQNLQNSELVFWINRYIKAHKKLLNWSKDIEKRIKESKARPQ